MGQRPRLVGGLAAPLGRVTMEEAHLSAPWTPHWPSEGMWSCPQCEHLRVEAWPPRFLVAWLNSAGWGSVDGARLGPARWKRGWAGAEGRLGGVCEWGHPGVRRRQ